MRDILYILLLSLCSHWANATTVVYDDVSLVPNPKTAGAEAFVSNPNGILNTETVHSLNSQFYALDEETGAEVAVVALNSIGSQDIEGFANSLFNHWGVGKAGRDNGVLILFVLDQRAIRFEIGYGLEGALPDAICKRIQTQAMIPEFKNGDYDAGILAGADIVTKIIKNEPVPEYIKGDDGLEDIIFITLSMFIAVGLLSWLQLQRKVKKVAKNKKLKTNISRYVAFKSDKTTTLGCATALVIVPVLITSFFASKLEFLLPALATFGALPVNIWAKRVMRKIRYAPIKCEKCSEKMYISKETDNEQSLLSASQQFEKQLRSADYDIFKCDSCLNSAVFKLDLSSTYSDCPECATKAFLKTNRLTILKPTYSATGMSEEEYSCLFCKYTKKKLKSIPRLQRSSGGSSSSRSSSSRSSFGGGRSGGGGSTSRW